jgi:glycosyltransferase involved in cell wall biosynthesis
MLISIVVPVFNNQGTLRKTFDGIAEQFRSKLTRHTFEILFVDDGSKDGSADELLAIKREHNEAKLLFFTKNFGQASAMAAGNRHASGDCVINISADLQDPIDLMSEMVERWESGFKIVACVRSGREESLFRSVPSNFLYRFLRLSIPNYPKQGFDYYLIDRAVLDVVNRYRVKESFIAFDILDTGYVFASIPYIRQERTVGKSGYSFVSRLRAAFDSVVNATFLPIRIMSFIGALTAVLGLIYACLMAYARLTNKIPIPGYALVVILILLTSGVNMLMLGVMGEYLWRALDTIKARPDYVIREKVF